jgi:hypothetical protein
MGNNGTWYPVRLHECSPKPTKIAVPTVERNNTDVSMIWVNYKKSLTWNKANHDCHSEVIMIYPEWFFFCGTQGRLKRLNHKIPWDSDFIGRCKSVNLLQLIIVPYDLSIRMAISFQCKQLVYFTICSNTPRQQKKWTSGKVWGNPGLHSGNQKYFGIFLGACYTFWLVVYLPLWKIWVRQLGWWHSQYMESQKNHVPTHQPDMYIYINLDIDITSLYIYGIVP